MIKIQKKLFGLFTLFLLISPLAFSKTPAMVGETLCHEPGYSCYKVKRKTSTWDTLWRNKADQDIVRRVNKMNVKLEKGMILAVPDNLDSVTLKDLSPFAHQRNGLSEKMILVDLNLAAWAAYDENGALVKWGPISSGQDFCLDDNGPCLTPSGNYAVTYKGNAECKSNTYPINVGGSPMAYCVFFKGGFALHAAPLPGYRASHGCVRLFVEDAQWINENFIDVPGRENGFQGTRISIIRPLLPTLYSSSLEL